jgi:hypothetical protein
MKLNTREQWLLAAACPIVVAGIHLSFVRSSFQSRRDSADARIASMEAANPPNDRERLDGVVRDLLAKRDAVAKRESDCTQGEQALLASWPTPGKRTSTVTAIAEILERQGAHVEHSRRAARDDLTLNVGMRELERTAVALGAQSPTVWRFDLRAEYETLVAALAELREPAVPAIPLAFQVEPVESFDQLRCTLWLWI